jgi:hypothetical protein
MVMETTDFWYRDDFAEVRKLHGAWFWTIHRERQMCSPLVIISEIVGQNVHQMPFVDDDDVIQALTPDAPDQPLDIRILPRPPGGDDDLFDPQMLYPLPKGSAIDAVPIAQEILKGLVPREGLHDLLSRPFRGGMLGDVEVDDTPSMMGPVPKT